MMTGPFLEWWDFPGEERAKMDMFYGIGFIIHGRKR